MDGAVIPKGSLILVTGATGMIGSNVVFEALQAGYKVRGTSRTKASAAKLEDSLDHHPNYSTAIVPDVSVAGAWDEAVKGVDSIIHMATDTSFESDPNIVVTATKQGVRNILRSAARTTSVKRFVLTSSSSAVLLPVPNKEIALGVDDWCQEAVDQAWDHHREKVFWNFFKEEKPKFIGNTILPNFIVGRILTSGGPTGGSVELLMKGTVPPFPPQYHVDVIDCARIHIIAAALDTKVKHERIFAFASPFSFTEMIGILKDLRPNLGTLATPPEDEGRDLSTVPNQLGAELLRKWYGQEDGYKTMRQSIEDALQSLDV